MTTDIAELVVILENELSMGEELLHNLEAQKNAILQWDIVDLLEQIRAREVSLRSLTELETKRSEVVKSINFRSLTVTLRQIIATLPHNSSERARLVQLRDETSKVFNRLHSEERSLHDFMKALLAHIQETFKSLAPALVPVYSESGAPQHQTTKPGLLHSKV